MEASSTFTFHHIAASRGFKSGGNVRGGISEYLHEQGKGKGSLKMKKLELELKIQQFNPSPSEHLALSSIIVKIMISDHNTGPGESCDV